MGGGRLGGFGASWVLTLLLAAPAYSIAVYTAEVSSTLTIAGFFDASGAPIAKPSDLVVEGEAVVFDEFESALGGASASASTTVGVSAVDPDDLDVGESVSLIASVAGSADAPPLSMAGSEARTNGLIFLDNRSMTETFQVAFELVTAFSADATLDDATSEQATADVQVILDSLSGGLLFDLRQLGPPTGSDAFPVTLVLGPREFDELGLINDAEGSAIALSEPRLLSLLGLALAGLSLQRGRRRFRRRFLQGGTACARVSASY